MPRKIGWSRKEMVTVSLVNCAVQPLSHNCPMERRLPDANDEKRCVSVAAGGKVGILMCALCVDSITALLGKRTRMPSATRFMLDRTGVEDLVKKW